MLLQQQTTKYTITTSLLYWNEKEQKSNFFATNDFSVDSDCINMFFFSAAGFTETHGISKRRNSHIPPEVLRFLERKSTKIHFLNVIMFHYMFHCSPQQQQTNKKFENTCFSLQIAAACESKKPRKQNFLDSNIYF